MGKTDGNVYVKGISLDQNPAQVRSFIGVTFQDSIRESGITGYETLVNHGVLYGMRKNEIISKSKPYLERLGLTEVANRFVETYSGGMRRKLEIIKGILPNPAILFLDEPTLGLDPQSRKQIWSFLNEMRQNGVTIFLTSHYVEEIERNADYVGIIECGEIKCIGTPQELITNTSKLSDTKTLEDVFLYFSESGKEAVE